MLSHSMKSAVFTIQIHGVELFIMSLPKLLVFVSYCICRAVVVLPRVYCYSFRIDVVNFVRAVRMSKTKLRIPKVYKKGSVYLSGFIYYVNAKLYYEKEHNMVTYIWLQGFSTQKKWGPLFYFCVPFLVNYLLRSLSWLCRVAKDHLKAGLFIQAYLNTFYYIFSEQKILFVVHSSPFISEYSQIQFSESLQQRNLSAIFDHLCCFYTFVFFFLLKPIRLSIVCCHGNFANLC